MGGMLRDKIDNLLFQYWESLPEPKKDYVNWWYGDGGVNETLNTYHLPETKEENND